MTRLTNLISTDLTAQEMEILEQANDILYGLQMELGCQLDMTSPLTGEVISTKELGRVRGILGGLSRQRVWTLSLDERSE